MGERGECDMTTKQPEALRLADALMMGNAMLPEIDLPEAAAELRRLHAEVERLSKLVPDVELAREAIYAKAEGREA